MYFGERITPVRFPRSSTPASSNAPNISIGRAGTKATKEGNITRNSEKRQKWLCFPLAKRKHLLYLSYNSKSNWHPL